MASRFPKTCRERTRDVVFGKLEREMSELEKVHCMIDRDGLAAHVEPFSQALKRLLTLGQEAARKGHLPLRRP
jgi:hypothetical protein